MDDVTRESVAAVTDHFADALVGEKHCTGIYDVVMMLCRSKVDADPILF